MSGLHRTTVDSEIDWERDDTFTNFKAYVVEQESGFERRLRLVKYRIDEVETLRSLIARGQRPETYILPVVFLLLRRSLAVIQQASTCVLDTLELGVLVWSLDTVWEAARDRVKILRTMFKFQNFNNPKQLGNFSHGLYAHLSGQIKMSPFWERDPAMDRAHFSFRRPLRTPPHIRDFYSDPKWDADPEMGCNSEWDLYSLTGLATDELPLSYPSPQVESLDDILAERPDLYAANAACAADPDPGGVVGSPRLLVGHWQGSYTDDDDDADRTDGLVILTITSHLSDGTVAGCGKDVHGPFTISGTLTGLDFAFIKTYAVLQSSDGEKVAWWYQAELQDADMNTMEGSWGLRQSFRARSRFLAPDDSESESESDSDPHADDLAVYGSFTFTRRPVGFHLACPSADEFAHNRPRALWKLAINVAIHLVHVRSRTIDWNFLRQRRQLREQYMQLHMKKVANPYSTNYLEEREREELIKRIHPDDLVVWNALGVMRSGCGIIHGSSVCRSCHKSPITGSRIVCIDCTHGVDETSDFCLACFSSNAHPLQPPHAVVQLRNIRMRVYLFSILNAAKSMLSQLEYLRAADCRSGGPSLPHISCVECQAIINPRRSYWYCLDCEGPTYLCVKCNSRIERQMSWLLGRTQRVHSSVHNWSHPLLFVSKADPTPPKQLSIEDRLSLLEAKIDALSTAVRPTPPAHTDNVAGAVQEGSTVSRGTICRMV